MADVISLINMKGGVGKTTLSILLSWHFFDQDKKVLLVDLDPQFNATQSFMGYRDFEKHTKEKGTLADLLIDVPGHTLRPRAKKRRPRKSVNNCKFNVRKSRRGLLDLLPSELNLSHVVKNPSQMEYKLERLLSPCREEYDFIFIDCAPTDSVLTTMALTASDFLLVPMKPDRFSILGFGLICETVAQFRENCNDPHLVSDLGVVFNQVTSSVTDQRCIQDLQATARRRDTKMHVFAAMLSNSRSYNRALYEKTPIMRTKYVRRTIKEEVMTFIGELTSRLAHQKTAKARNK